MLLCFVSVMLSCVFIAAFWSPDGKGLPLGSVECDDFLCFCHFLMGCPGSGVALVCMDS